MPRPERLLRPEDGPVQRLAAQLRELRVQAGNPSYRKMASQVGYSATTLSDAAGGRQLPGLAVVRAYVAGCGGDEAGWEDRWREAAAELAAIRAPATQQAAVAPYQGLTAFQQQDADRFFGRQRLVDELVERLARDRFLVVSGASGSGKSSLLRAGLLPAMAASRPYLLTPGPNLTDDLPADAGLVIVDQFEEVFTLCRDAGERERFIARLLSLCVDPETDTRLVLGVRADFLSSCTHLPALASAMKNHILLVGPMSEEELQLAVSGPAGQAAITVERALLAQVLAETKGQPGYLPMLSHALLETWRHRRGGVLTLAGYLAAGGVTGAIARTAEEIHAEYDEEQRATVRKIMIRLTSLGDGTEDTRRRVQRSELDFPHAERLIDDLVAARLLVVEGEYVEVAHEALIGAWPRLQQWLTEDRGALREQRRLTEATEVWQSLSHDLSGLYRGTRLALAQEWAQLPEHRADLTPAEQSFLTASVAAEAAEQAVANRRSRQLKRLTAGLAAMLVLAATAAGAAVWQWRNAVDQTRQATSRQLASEALALARTDVQQALRTSLAGYAVAPTVEARGALLSLASQHHYTARFRQPEPVKDLAYGPDGSTLVTAGQNGEIVVWDLATRTERNRMTGGHRADPASRAVRAIAVSSKGMIASAGLDGAIIVWNAVHGRPMHWLRSAGDDGVVGESVAFSPDGTMVAATTSEEGKIRLWRAIDGVHLGDLPGHGGFRSDVAFSPDGTRLISSGTDKTAKLWDLTTRTLLRQSAPQRGQLLQVAFSPDGRTAAMAGNDPDVVLWDTVTGAESYLRGHSQSVRAMSFTPDGARLISGGYDEYAIVWDAKTKLPVTRFEGHTSEIYGLAVSPDGRSIATSSRDTSVLLYDEATQPMAGHSNNITDLCLSPDGKLLFSAGRTTVVRWDPVQRRRLGDLSGHTARIADMAFSADGTRVATASDDNTVRLWATTGPAGPQVLKGHVDQVWTVDFSPDGTLVASSGTDNTVRLWDTATGRLIRILHYTDTFGVRVLFSPDGRQVIVGSQDGRISAVNLDGKVAYTLREPLPGGDATMSDLALSPDGSRIAVGNSDGTVTLWDTRTGTGVALPKVHTGNTSALAFSPDGTMLATGSGDQTVVLWNVATRQVFAELTGHEYDVSSVVWSPDGRTVYSGSGDRTIVPWLVRPEDAVAALNNDLARNFPSMS